MKIEEISHQNQYDEYKMCTFQPTINRSRPKKQNGPVIVKGFGRFLELKELAKKLRRKRPPVKTAPSRLKMQNIAQGTERFQNRLN